MRVMDEAARAVVALTNRLVDAGVKPLNAKELWHLLDVVGDPAKLVGRSSGDLASEFNSNIGDTDRVATLLDSGITLAVRLGTLHERGIWTITPFDDDYPSALRERLGSAAPPVLYGAGERSLLALDGIGIVGSRDVTEEGADVARATARGAARRGLTTISGGARGVDQLAMAAAEQAGGSVVGILADSLERAIGSADTRRALLDGTACLATPYRPDAGFSAGNAMGRNKIVYGLSRVTLVVATAQGKGGTWSGATEALKKRFATVAVWRGEGEGPGNAPLESTGAVAIGDVDDLFDLPSAGGIDDRSASTTAPTQLSLSEVEPPTYEPNGTSAEPASPVAEPENTSSPVAEAEPVHLSGLSLPGVLVPGALVPEPTGVCWCGCGADVPDGKFFVSRHAPGAAQRALIAHFGSVEAFLALMGDPETLVDGPGEPGLFFEL